ncbi:MAG: DUF5689 domain-containing protein [Rikenellaceae bacterium]
MRGWIYRHAMCAFWTVGLSLMIDGCAPSGVSSYVDGGDDGIGGSSDSESSGSEFVTVVSISHLKSLYLSSSLLITNDLAIEGVITANDAYGEFPSSIVIEDSSGAIEIMCDLDCATSGYIVGATVRVACSGMWLGSSSGMLALGDAPYDQVAVSELSEEVMLRCARVTTDEGVTPIPATAMIPYIDQSYILRYVVIHSLSVVVEGGYDDDSLITFCSRNSETGLTENTTHTLVDLSGNTITLNVNRNVIYADELIPTTPRSIYAIVEYFGGEYQLRIVNCGY